MEKIAETLRKNQADDEDVQFWSMKTPAQRLDALQVLRERHLALFFNGPARRSITIRFRRIRKTAQVEKFRKKKRGSRV